MIVSRQIPRILCFTLLMVACAPVPVSQNSYSSPSAAPTSLPLTVPSNDPAQLSTDIRPSTKGQRLELTGELEIPAGTSSYTIQSVSAPASSRFAALDLLIAPAWAEDDVLADGDEPISDSQINQLTATVNDEKVNVSIEGIEDQSDGAKLVKYRLKDVPESEDNAVVEFTAPMGYFKLKTVVPKLAEGVKKLDRLNVETTALAEVILNHPKKFRKLSEAELQGMLKTDAVQKVRDKIVEILIKPGSKPQRFEENLTGSVKEILKNSPEADFLDKVESCNQRGLKCLQRPVLPPPQEHPIPADLQALIKQRQALRLKLVAGTHPPTPQERMDLLKLGILLRHKECINRKIFPCP